MSEQIRIADRLEQSDRDKIERKFHRFVREWKAAVGPSSSAVQMTMHPAYQQIIGIGEPAIPLLLHELQRDPDHWFWALHAITGENPVPAESRGRLDGMADAWLDFGRRHGYVC
jgi:hypothetical protein